MVGDFTTLAWAGILPSCPVFGIAAMPTVLVYRSSLLSLSETFISEQLGALRRWKGILIGLRQLAQLPLDGIDIRTLRGHPPTLLERVRWKIHGWLGMIPRSAAARLEAEGASLLHVHFGVDAVEAWPIAKALELPMLVTLHGYDMSIDRAWWETGKGGRRMRTYPARLLELAQQPRVRFIAVSDAIRQRAMSWGIPESRISVCYIGIDCTKFTPFGLPIADRQRRILFVGRLEEKKGCEYLIRAFAKVQASVSDASLIIIGDGTLRDHLQKLALELGVHAEFRGSLSNLDVRHELSLARAFCLPSVRAGNGDAEGLPIVLLEAQASAIPVVTSASGGTMEAIKHGVTGLAVPERDVDALAGALTTLLTDDAVATSMSSAGPAFVAGSFDIRSCTEHLEAAYDAIVLLDRT